METWLGISGWVLEMVLRARLGRDDDERALVKRLAGARKAPVDVVVRARMVQLSWAGQRVPAIADELGCSQKTVRRWLHRFNRCGIAHSNMRRVDPDFDLPFAHLVSSSPVF